MSTVESGTQDLACAMALNTAGDTKMNPYVQGLYAGADTNGNQRFFIEFN